jgi:hypothetical protein
MTSETGRSGSVAEVMTREVRWFFPGPLAGDLREWFTSAAHTHERRVDVYDLASARNGVGRKHRGDATLDTKYRANVFENVVLAPRIAGHVEDWMKLSQSLRGERTRPLTDPLPVDKIILGRRYPFDGDQDSGCEVELAEIEVGGLAAWSLCFETFGNAEARGLALRSGFDRFLADTPLPRGLHLAMEASVAYPGWISRVTSRAA